MGKRTAPCLTEHQEQVHVISWARGTAQITGDKRLLLLHGDSSGVRVPIGCAGKMKRAGAVKGWPDLFLPVCSKIEIINRKYSFNFGLFIELKRVHRGVVSSEQKALHEALREQGYRVEVCRGAEQAIEVIKAYLGLK